MLPKGVEGAARALAWCLFDSGSGIEESRLAWTMRDVDDFTRRAGIKTRLAFLIVLRLLEHLPLFLIGKPRRFSRLAVEDRVRMLEKIEDTSLAPLVVLPKAMLCLVYFEHPDTLAEIGFDGAPLRPRAELPAVGGEP